MDEFELELKHDFLEEATDLLNDAESAFLSLEDSGDKSAILDNIFRLAHNLKGTSKAVGFGGLADLTHVAENLILKLKEGELEIQGLVVTTLLEFKDRVVDIIEILKEDVEASYEINDIIIKIEECLAGKISLEELPEEDMQKGILVEEPAVEISQAALDSLAELGIDYDTTEKTEIVNDSDVEISSAALDSLRELGIDTSDIEGVTPESNPVILSTKESAAIVEEKSSSSKKSTVKASVDNKTIRVNLSKIDDMNNVIGELIIMQNVLYQRRFEMIKDDLANKTIGMMGKVLKEIQELSMSLRMLPIDNTFKKMSRIVRDTSASLDKKINLNTLGEDTEVDKTVLEKLADPLVHIVRNAIDHGIETREGRVAVGKDETGNVELYAFHEGSNLVIQITDDGKGINPSIIKEKAIAKGVITATSNLTENEIIQLIFHPGLSTKESVTELSGRGVGMDVVKTNIESIGGKVLVKSRVGEGTSFKIILPLTLAIIEGLNVGVDNQNFIIPLGQVYEFTNTLCKDIQKFTGTADLFKLRGEVVPLFYLSDKLKLKRSDSESLIVIIVRGLSHSFGVVIDDVVNQQQIVIKKLGEDIRGKKGVMGSAIMANGKPSLILDLFELFKDDLKVNNNFRNLTSSNVA